MKIWFALFAAFKLMHFIRCSSSEKQEAAEEKVKRMLAGQEYIFESGTTLILSKSISGTKAKMEQQCANLGGALLSVTSNRKAAEMDSYFSTSYHAWTSASKPKRVNGVWKWGTNELLIPGIRKAYTYSHADQPDYTGMIYPYHITDVGDVFQAEPPSSSAQLACEVDGKQRPNRYSLGHKVYKYLKTTFMLVKSPGINYTEAKSQCLKESSGHLAAPTSFKELRVIDEYMNKTNSNNLWLGARRKFYNDDKKWVTGEPIAENLRNWPRDTGGKCLIYKFKKGMFTWINCNDKNIPMGYICQIDDGAQSLHAF